MRTQTIFKLYSLICIIWVTILTFISKSEGEITNIKKLDWLFISLSLLSVIFIAYNKYHINPLRFTMIMGVVIFISFALSLFIWVFDFAYGTLHSEVTRNVTLLMTTGLFFSPLQLGYSFGIQSNASALLKYHILLSEIKV
jgi:hypothetical protein